MGNLKKTNEKRIRGWAEPGGGRERRLFPPVHSDAVRTLGKTGLRAAKIGYGAYRARADIQEHRQTLADALAAGCSLIDTSTNYSDGLSERLVGETLKTLIQHEKIERSETIVVSKAGYVQASNYDRARQAEADGQPYPEMVPYADGLWHCIHPVWLEEELERSLSRLQLERLDFLLLHNPEYFLSHAAKRGVPLSEAREAFYERVGRAFEAMERFAQEGRIGWYGVSSNAFAVPKEDAEHVSLGRLLACAEAASGGESRFAAAQAPLNLLETGAFSEAADENGRSFLQTAQENDIAVFVNRPLNAILDDALFRLAEYPADEDAPAPLETFALTASVERDIHLSLRKWRVDIQPEQYFRVGETAKRLYPKTETAVDWIHFFERRLAPAAMSAALDAEKQIDESRRDEWTALKKRYAAALQTMAHASVSQRNRSDAIVRAPLRAALSTALGAPADNMTLSEIALNAAASVPGVSVVLNGMKRRAYLSEAQNLLRLPDFTDPLAAFRAAAEWSKNR